MIGVMFKYYILMLGRSAKNKQHPQLFKNIFHLRSYHVAAALVGGRRGGNFIGGGRGGEGSRGKEEGRREREVCGLVI